MIHRSTRKPGYRSPRRRKPAIPKDPLGLLSKGEAINHFHVSYGAIDRPNPSDNPEQKQFLVQLGSKSVRRIAVGLVPSLDRGDNRARIASSETLKTFEVELISTRRKSVLEIYNELIAAGARIVVVDNIFTLRMQESHLLALNVLCLDAYIEIYDLSIQAYLSFAFFQQENPLKSRMKSQAEKAEMDEIIASMSLRGRKPDEGGN